MPKFRKKPIEIEAFQFREHASIADWPTWAQAVLLHNVDGMVVTRHVEVPKDRRIVHHGDHLQIPTLEGVMRANDGDYVIQGVKGEIYPCKPEIFEASYDAVSS
jgi:hypothetical protein